MFLFATPTIHVDNLKEGAVLRYPIALIRGSANGDTVLVRNLGNAGQDGTNRAHVVSGRFKVLVELRPGTNDLLLSAGGAKSHLHLKYAPQTSEYKINLIYLTDQDGSTAYTSPLAKDPQNYLDKLDTLAKLMQTLTAESLNDRGLGRKTFNLDFDSKGRVKVLTLRYPASIQTLRKTPIHQLYDQIYGWLGAKGLYDKRKNVVVMAFSNYEPETHTANAHIAWGGGDMGLFSSLSTFAWPNSIRDVERAFSDSTPLDPKLTYDDSFGRSNYWGQASTGMGAVTHEMGHTFVGAEHSGDPESMMSRGFDHFNRFFISEEAPAANHPGKLDFSDDQVAKWDVYNASLMSTLRFFEPDKRTYTDDRAPRIFVDFDRDQDVVIAPNGVRLLHFWKQTDPPSHTHYRLFDDSPTIIRISRSKLRQFLGAPEGAAIHVTDCDGQVFSVNEIAFKTREDLPPITSKDYFDQLRRYVGDKPVKPELSLDTLKS